jgi:hypothetical protein
MFRKAVRSPSSGIGEYTYALIVIMKYPRQPLQVRLDNTARFELAFRNHKFEV